jgi:hypothetical protein
MHLPSWLSWLWPPTFATVSAIIVGLFAVVRFIQGWVWAVQARKIERARPFLELRQKLYLEALHQVAILTTSDVKKSDVKESEGRKPEELAAARQRFKELYVAELSMVEPKEVEESMVQLAREIVPELEPLTAAQQKAYDLAHALRDTFIVQYGLKSKILARLRSWLPRKPQEVTCPDCGKKFVPRRWLAFRLGLAVLAAWTGSGIGSNSQILKAGKRRYHAPCDSHSSSVVM